MKFISVILFVFLLSSFTTYAQKDEIILELKNGKLLKGYGKLTKRGVKFKYAKKEKPIIFSYEKMKEMKKIINDTTQIVYRYVKLKEKESKPEVAILVHEGKVSLYKDAHDGGGHMMMTGASNSPTYVGAGGSKPVHLYVKKEEEAFASKITSLWFPPKYFKDHSAEYFSDCPELVKKIINKEYKKSSAADMVAYYNKKCTK